MFFSYILGRVLRKPVWQVLRQGRGHQLRPALNEQALSSESEQASHFPIWYSSLEFTGREIRVLFNYTQQEQPNIMSQKHYLHWFGGFALRLLYYLLEWA